MAKLICPIDNNSIDEYTKDDIVMYYNCTYYPKLTKISLKGDKIRFICKHHGRQYQELKLFHIGCNKCNELKIYIKKANNKYNNMYSYMDIDQYYENIDYPIEIYCPYHGDFETTMRKHLLYYPCPKCRNCDNAEHEGCCANLRMRRRKRRKHLHKILQKYYDCEIVVLDNSVLLRFDDMDIKIIMDTNQFKYNNHKFNKDIKYIIYDPGEYKYLKDATLVINEISKMKKDTKTPIYINYFLPEPSATTESSIG